MDPRRFLDVALTLKGGPGSAELYRTSIGRAYYAAFNVGVETLWSIGVQCSRGPGAHGELMNCLRGGGDQACQRIGALLQTLHSRRIDSDYEMADPGVETRGSRSRLPRGERRHNRARQVESRSELGADES